MVRNSETCKACTQMSHIRHADHTKSFSNWEAKKKQSQLRGAKNQLLNGAAKTPFPVCPLVLTCEKQVSVFVSFHESQSFPSSVSFDPNTITEVQHRHKLLHDLESIGPHALPAPCILYPRDPYHDLNHLHLQLPLFPALLLSCARWHSAFASPFPPACSR